MNLSVRSLGQHWSPFACSGGEEGIKLTLEGDDASRLISMAKGEFGEGLCATEAYWYSVII
jgi:hypothetical protein